MRRVTLARSWNPGTARYRPGDTVEVEETTAEWLESCGALVTGRTDPAPRSVVTPKPEKEQEAPVSPVESGPEKPKRAASVDVWREYATAQGMDVKGLSKKEIIAAVR